MFPAYPQFELANARIYEGIELVSALPLVLGISAILSRPFWKAPVAWKLFLSASLLYLLVYLFFQFRGSHIRYIFPAIPMLAIGGGWALAAAAEGSHRAFHVVEGSLIVAAVSLAIVVAGTGGFSGDPHARWVALSGLGAASVLLVLLWLLHIFPRSLSRPGLPAGSVREAPRHLIVGRPRAALMVAVAVLLFLPSFPTMLVVGYPGEERSDSAPLEGLSVPTFEQAMVRRFGDDYLMWKWINAELPRNSTIISFDPRVYYLDRSVLPATSYNLAGTYRVTLDRAVNESLRHGATHILDSPWPRDVEVIRPFYERSVLFHNLGNTTLFQPVHAEGSVRLYLILGGGGSPEG
jgi:hypothetical protein